MHGSDDLRDGHDQPDRAEARSGGPREATEGEWGEVNYLLEVGELTWSDVVEELFERGLIRKAVGVTPVGQPEPGQEVVIVLEISRERLVPGPRLLHAIHGSRGWGVLGGRLLRPVSDQVRWDTGLLSTELPESSGKRTEAPPELYAREVERAVAVLIERVGSDEAWRWLRASHPALSGQSPLYAIVAHDVRRVSVQIDTLDRPAGETGGEHR